MSEVSDAVPGRSRPAGPTGPVVERAARTYRRAGCTVDYNVYTAAPTDATTLVLIHGGFCSGADWRHQLEPLAALHGRVIVPDLRGHGQSRPVDPQTCTVDDYAVDVLGILAQEQVSSAVLVGHSLGCRVVLAAAHAGPDVVAGIVLLDGSRLAPPTQDGEPAILSAVREVGPAAVLSRLFQNMFVGAETEQVRTQVLDGIGGFDAETATAIIRGTLAWDADQLESTLAGVGEVGEHRPVLPVMAIQSSDVGLDGARRSLSPGDRSTPWTELVGRYLPQLEVEIVPGVGHFCMLEAPQQVTAAIARFATACRSAPLGVRHDDLVGGLVDSVEHPRGATTRGPESG